MARKIISNNWYKGIRSYSGKPNKLTKIFYSAKFHKDNRALKYLIKLTISELTEFIKNNEIDYITSVNTVLSKYNMPREVAKEVARKFKTPYIEIFKDANQNLKVSATKIKGKNVLVIDDVIYSGSTIRRCDYLLNQAKVKNRYFYAMLKSRSFQK